VGVGFMVFQQLGGINGVAFYATYIFSSADNQNVSNIVLAFCNNYRFLPAAHIFLG